MAWNGVAVEELVRGVRFYVSSEEFRGFTDVNMREREESRVTHDF